MKVTVNFYSRILANGTRSFEIELAEGDTLTTLLEYITNEYKSHLIQPIYNKEKGTCTVGILVNGRQEKLTRVLQAGDQVSILPLVAGG